MSKSWKQYLRKDPVCPKCNKAVSSLKGVERISYQVIKCPHCSTELSFALQYPVIALISLIFASLAMLAVMFLPDNMQSMNLPLQIVGAVFGIGFVISNMQIKFVGQS